MQKTSFFLENILQIRKYFEDVNTFKSGKAELASKLCIYLAQVFILKSIKKSVNKKPADCWDSKLFSLHCAILGGFRDNGGKIKSAAKEFREFIFYSMCSTDFKRSQSLVPVPLEKNK